ncbi:MAG TPA: bifunctional nuclease domain-containing protein [Streptosporangiaceae bacterium]|jgi:hypothetical protein
MRRRHKRSSELDQPAQDEEHREIAVGEIRMVKATGVPYLLLTESGSERYLTVETDMAGAGALTHALRGSRSERPLTHELLGDVLAAVGLRISRADLTGLERTAQQADLVLTHGQKISAAPVDAIALALWARAPIFTTPEIIDRHGATGRARRDKLFSLPARGAAADMGTSPGLPEAYRRFLSSLPSTLVSVVGILLEDDGSGLAELVLTDDSSQRYLPLPMGAQESLEATLAQQGESWGQPQGHELFTSILDAAGVRLSRADIALRRQGAYYASLVLSNGQIVTARPMDATGFAVSVGAPIYASTEILDDCAGPILRTQQQPPGATAPASA